MGTAADFLANPKRRAVTVISGRVEFLRRRSLDVLISSEPFEDKKKKTASGYPEDVSLRIERVSAKEWSLARIFEYLSQPITFGEGFAICVDDAHLIEWQDSPVLERWLADPTPGAYLILDSEIVKDRQTRVRWLESKSTRILYIDCNSPTALGLLGICKAAGLSDPDAEWLIRATAGDCTDICRALDLMDIWKKPWPPGLVQRLYVGSTTATSNAIDTILREWMINPAVQDNRRLTSIARRRLHQALILSVGATDKNLTIVDRAARADCDTREVGRLTYLAKQKNPREWLSRLARAVRLDNEARYGMPVREMVAEVLTV